MKRNAYLACDIRLATNPGYLELGSEIPRSISASFIYKLIVRKWNKAFTDVPVSQGTTACVNYSRETGEAFKVYECPFIKKGGWFIYIAWLPNVKSRAQVTRCVLENPNRAHKNLHISKRINIQNITPSLGALWENLGCTNIQPVQFTITINFAKVSDNG